MKNWICAAIVFVLAGCATVPSIPTHSLTQRTALPDSGGTFSVNDSGKFGGLGCGPYGPGSLFFYGSGVGTFIHRNKESGSLSSGRSSCKFSGTAAIVSKERPADSITMALTFDGLFCYHGQPSTMAFTINGGTGRFAQATGSGTVVFHCSLQKRGTYTDVWSGAITF